MFTFPPSSSSYLFFFNDTATTEIYTLSLHDALPICARTDQFGGEGTGKPPKGGGLAEDEHPLGRDEPPFFSALTRAVEQSKQAKGPPALWQGIIKNLPGVKNEERLWSGVHDWLGEQKGQVTKQQVLDHLRANEVQVHTVMHGPDVEDEKPGWESIPASTTKFQQYTLPGGKNYREMLLTTPHVGPDTIRPDAQAGRDHGPAWDKLVAQVQENRSKLDPIRFKMVYGSQIYERANAIAHEKLPGASRDDVRAVARHIEDLANRGRAGRFELHQIDQDFAAALDVSDRAKDLDRRDSELRRTMDDLHERMINESYARVPEHKKAIWTQGHFDEPNVLAHVRMDDRTGPSGERILHLAELQSDLHQAGRKRGYASDVAEWNRRKEEILRENGANSPEMNAHVATAPTNVVPDFPFKTSCHELGLN